jgi:TPR repeat protein
MRLRPLVLVSAVLGIAACAKLEDAARQVDAKVAELFADAPQSEAERHYKQGLRYFNGDGVAADPAKGVAEFRVAAAEVPDAAFMLGLAYRSGRGVSRDDAVAVSWFRQAADKGHGDAQFMLGLAALRGTGTAEDPAAARTWFEKAAAQGLAGAEYHLGVMNAAGLGGMRDDARALVWLEKAAAQNHPEAQFALAEAHTNGRGTPVDHAWAARWYGKAAEQGLVRAQYMLGVAYATGLGLPKDLPESARWLTLAALKGDTDAARLRDAVNMRISGREREMADAWAQRWRARAPGPFADPPTIRFVQFALSRVDIDPGPVDGTWGTQTERAAAAFRQRTGMTVATSLTPDLLSRLKDERLRREK